LVAGFLLFYFPLESKKIVFFGFLWFSLVFPIGRLAAQNNKNKNRTGRK
jgi:hypothetical protein